MKAKQKPKPKAKAKQGKPHAEPRVRYVRPKSRTMAGKKTPTAVSALLQEVGTRAPRRFHPSTGVGLQHALVGALGAPRHVGPQAPRGPGRAAVIKLLDRMLSEAGSIDSLEVELRNYAGKFGMLALLQNIAAPLITPRQRDAEYDSEGKLQSVTDDGQQAVLVRLVVAKAPKKGTYDVTPDTSNGPDGDSA